MSKVQGELNRRRALLEDSRMVLHQSKDEATGQALSKLLTIHLEQSLAKLMIVTDVGDFRAAQAEAQAYQKLLDLQQQPPIQLNNK